MRTISKRSSWFRFKLFNVGWKLFDFDTRSPDIIFNMKINLLSQIHIISHEIDILIDQMINQDNFNKNKLDRKLYTRRSQKQEQELLEQAYKIFIAAMSWKYKTEIIWQTVCHKIALEFIINSTINLRLGREVYLDTIYLPKYKEIDIEGLEEENDENDDNIQYGTQSHINRQIKFGPSRQDNMIDFCLLAIPYLRTDLFAFIERFKQKCDFKLQYKNLDKGCLSLMVIESKSDQGTLFEAENQLAEASIKILVSLQAIGGEAAKLPVLGIAMVARSWTIYLTIASKDEIGQTIFITQPIWAGIVSRYRHAIEACSILRAFALWIDTTTLGIISACLRAV